MKTKFTWGTIIKPTEEAVRRTQDIKIEDYAISLGKSRNGDLALVRAGKRSLEFWSANYWEVLKDI